MNLCFRSIISTNNSGALLIRSEYFILDKKIFLIPHIIVSCRCPSSAAATLVHVIAARSGREGFLLLTESIEIFLTTALYFTFFSRRRRFFRWERRNVNVAAHTTACVLFGFLAHSALLSTSSDSADCSSSSSLPKYIARESLSARRRICI